LPNGPERIIVISLIGPTTYPSAQLYADRRSRVRDRYQPPLVRLPQPDAIAKDSLVRRLVLC